VIDELEIAAREDDVAAIVLGCAGMVDIPRRAAGRVSARIIDGVVAAAGLAVMLSRA
jgi:allantoin racemase